MRIRLARVAPERGIFPPLPASPNREELKAKGSALAETQGDTQRLESAGLTELVTGVSENCKRVDTLIREEEALSNRVWETNDRPEKDRLRRELGQSKGKWEKPWSELLRQKQQLEIGLLKLGSPLDVIRQKIEAVDFTPPKGYSPKAGIVRGLATFQPLVDAIPACVSVLMAPQSVGMRLSTSSGKRKRVPRKKKPPRPTLKKNASASEIRAAWVASVFEELTILEPRMQGMVSSEDYRRIAKEYARFVTFRVAGLHPEIEEKVNNLQEHRRYIRLAQEIVAAKFSRELNTIQTDWKNHKPKKYRQRNK